MSTGREPSVVTFLFTDIVGSTQLHDAMGDEAAQEIVRLHNQLVRAEVATHGGSEVKTMGDGFMIAFRSVTSALHCAVGIQRGIERHNREQPTLAFRVRMGLNAGEAIEEEEDFFGTAVIVAARIAALADGAQILTSATVRQLAQGMRGIEYEFKGEFQLKGLREPYQIYQVISGAAAAPGLGRARFVGRERELAILKEELERTTSGSGAFVLLTGEPGIGKTWLADEVMRYAKTMGVRVYRGRCYEMEGSPPYTPFIEILREYVKERADEVLEADLGDYAEEIARLVPEVARRIRTSEARVPLPPEQERFRLMEAVRHLLEQISRRRPLLLVLEDAHWADAASELLLRHLAPALTTSPILMVGTSAKATPGPSDAIAGAIAEFGRLQVYRHLGLSGLEAEEIGEMLETMGRQGPVHQGLVEWIYEETEGNPFFVTELIHHLNSEGKLLQSSGEWVRDFSPQTWDIPDSVRVVIQRRLDALTDEARKVMTVASVAGRDFAYDLLEAVDEVPPEALLDGLEEGIRSGMIEETEGAVARFRFCHQITRQALYEQLSGLRRQRHHMRIGEALEQMGGAEPEEIAHHLRQAGNMVSRDKTQRYLVLAGDKARRMAAWEAAADYYEQALQLTAPNQKEERAGLLSKLGEAESGRGNWEKAVASLREAMELYEGLNEGETVGWIAYSLRRLYGARGQFTEASDVVARGLAALGDTDSEARSRLLAQAGFIRSAFGDAEEAERLLSQSIGTAERLNAPAAKGFAAFIMGMHCLNYTRLFEASDWLNRGTQWSLEGEDLWSASQGSSFRRHIMFILGDLAEAEQDMDNEERLARKAGNFLAICETKWISSSIACLRGDLELAERMACQLLELIEASRADSGIPGALINLAYIRFLSGDEGAYEELLARAIATYDKMSAAPIDDPRPVLFFLRAMAGRFDEARDMLPGLERYLHFEDHWTTSLGEARTTLGAGLGLLGKKEAATRLYEPLREWTGQTGYVLTGASSIPQLVSRALGMAAGAAGLPDEASTQFRTAIRQASEMNALTELAEANYWYARHILLDRPSGDRRYALDLLSEARRTWERLGMARQLDRAADLESAARGD
ncbi:MAG TPA: BREX system ATP-binding domain-containing protein [Dehalococcoidia bacterium]|nr:BREX system ATP-binding domain-containing protein [Dehalococcoidia bacterium]